MVPPAPTAFSTVTVCPSDLPIGIAIIRATTSVGPPAANGTSIAIGRSGKAACAAAPNDTAARAAASRGRRKGVMGAPCCEVVLGPEPTLPLRRRIRLRTFLESTAAEGGQPAGKVAKTRKGRERNFQ